MGSPPSSHSGSLTLAELNSTLQTTKSSVTKATLASTQMNLPPHMSSCSIGDTGTLDNSSPLSAFAEKEAGFDDLSASFRSLYKSLFDSVGYHNDSGIHHHAYPPPPGTISTPEPPPLVTVANADLNLGLSSSFGSHLFNQSNKFKNPEPRFTTLMDSLRDLAESNQWEQLTPLQIQSLRDSVGDGDHKQFGMDQDTFAEWSHSFNQFLSQLDNRLPSHSPSSSNPNISMSSGRLHNTFPAHHQLPVHSTHIPPPPPYSQTLIHHLTASPTTIHSPHGTLDPPYLSSLHDQTPNLNSGTCNTLNLPPFRSVATDLFEDTEEEDEFDWSKLV